MDNNQVKIIESYIDICNEVLEKNKNNFPFNRMWEAIKNKCYNQNINIALINDQPEPICNLSISEDGVILSKIRTNNTHKDCHMKMSYIKHVLQNKDIYVSDPALIDWHWIETMIENYKSPQG